MWSASPARGWDDREAFIAHEKKIFLWGYERQLMQSQPAHIEIIAEKLTVQSILKFLDMSIKD